MRPRRATVKYTVANTPSIASMLANIRSVFHHLESDVGADGGGTDGEGGESGGGSGGDGLLDGGGDGNGFFGGGGMLGDDDSETTIVPRIEVG